MDIKITYKDGKVEKFLGYDSMEEDGNFVKFLPDNEQDHLPDNERDQEVWVSTDLIAKIE